MYGKRKWERTPFASLLSKTTQNEPLLLGFSIFIDLGWVNKKKCSWPK